MTLDVKDNVKAIQQQLGKKSKKVSKAANQAINKTIGRGKTMMKRELKEALTTKTMKPIADRMTIWKSNPRTLYGNIKIKDKFLNLINFKGARQDKKPGGGVIATVAGVSRKYKGHFIAMSPSSKGSKRLAWHRKGSTRMPIDTSVGKGISQAYEKRKQKIGKFMSNEFLEQLHRAIKYHLNK